MSVVLRLRKLGRDQPPDLTDVNVEVGVGLKVMLIALAQRSMGTPIAPHGPSSILCYQKQKLEVCVLWLSGSQVSEAPSSDLGSPQFVASETEQCPHLDSRGGKS